MAKEDLPEAAKLTPAEREPDLQEALSPKLSLSRDRGVHIEPKAPQMQRSRGSPSHRSRSLFFRHQTLHTGEREHTSAQIVAEGSCNEKNLVRHLKDPTQVMDG
uniref:Uncharacterized protein n=1 Tax=Sphaerodactylus townsendi TaxID=933632 RepID=A0ACB8EFL7_9SAUR